MPKVYFWPGTGRSDRVVAGDLQEDAGIRAALVGLAGGMQEARAKAKTGGDAFLVADGVANRLQLRFVRVVHLDVAEHGEIIAGVEASEMRAQIADERRVTSRGLLQRGGVLSIGEKLDARFLQDRRFGRKRAFLLVLRRELVVSILLASTSG